MWPWISLERESCWIWNRGQVSASVTITQFLFLLVNHPIMWRIYMTVRLITWKQGWIYGRGYMWFKWSMEHLLINFTWLYGSFSLLMGLPSSGVILYGVVLLCWYGLVSGPNWELIYFLQTQSDGLVEVLYLYGDYSFWIGCYGPIRTSMYLIGINSHLPQICSWLHPWWIFNVRHVGYLKVCHTIKKVKSLILLSLQLL